MPGLPRVDPYDYVSGTDFNLLAESIDGGSASQGTVLIRDSAGRVMLNDGALVVNSIQSDPYVPMSSAGGVSGSRGTFALDTNTGFQFWDSNSNRVVYIDILTGNVTLGNANSPATLTLNGGTIIGATIKSTASVPSTGITVIGGKFELDTAGGLRLWDVNDRLVIQLAMNGAVVVNDNNGQDFTLNYLRPTTPTVTYSGVPGASLYGYYVIASNNVGDGAPYQIYYVGGAGNPLTAAKVVTISWPAVPGATQYKVIRAAGPMALGRLTTITADGSTSYSYADIGTSVSAYTTPTKGIGGQLGVNLIGAPRDNNSAIHAASLAGGGDAAFFEAGGVSVLTLQPPSGLAVTPHGGGAVTRFYKVVTVDWNATESLPSSAVSATGNAPAAGDPWTITWNVTPGAQKYIVLRSADGGVTYPQISTVSPADPFSATVSLTDNGLTSSAYTSQVVCNSGGYASFNNYVYVTPWPGGTLPVFVGQRGSVPVLVDADQSVSGTQPTLTVKTSVGGLTYQDLLLELVCRGTAAAANSELLMTFNGDVGANYAHERLTASGAVVAAQDSAAVGQTSCRNFYTTANTATANMPGVYRIWIPNYAGGFNKFARTDGFFYNSAAAFPAAGGMAVETTSHVWNSTATITTITITIAAGNFAAGSSLRCWGLP